MRTIDTLKAAVAMLGIAAIITSTRASGDRGPEPKLPSRPVVPAPGQVDTPVSRFLKSPVTTYQTQKGETLFALQLKPKLDAAATQPRDLVVVIDTSASQAGMPLDVARKIVEQLAKTAGPDDRIAIWTVNLPSATKDLTRGLKSVKSDAVASALKVLQESEYASGATDLKEGLAKVLKSFEQRPGRRLALVFLGDGESAYNPLNDADRKALADSMVSQGIAFFSVPLGDTLNSKNLHGLATATGGAAVRLEKNEGLDKFAARLHQSIAAPIIFPTQIRFGNEVVEYLPTKLPPLRGDVPTLIVGRAKNMSAKLECTIEGTFGGQAVTVKVSEPTSPPQLDNYFLVSVIDQWQQAEARELPAFIRADRALVLAYEQTRLARDDYLMQAHWAISQDNIDAAENLFKAVQRIDPNDVEAATGLDVIAKIRTGQVTRQQLTAMANRPANGKRIVTAKRGGDDKLPEPKQVEPKVDEPKQPAGGVLPNPKNDGGNLLEQERRRQLIAEQEFKVGVEQAIRESRKILPSDPETALELLRRQRQSVLDNPDLSPNTRQALLGQVQSVLQSMTADAARIQQNLEAARNRAIRQQAQEEAEARRRNQEETTRARIKAFTTLMNQARFEEAYRQALVMRQEAVVAGRPIPVEATAAYTMSLTATNLRELQELRRLREERFLITMMSVERSHVPYPDEPPVHFPPATVWRELTALRKERYDSTGLGSYTTPQMKALTNKLNAPTTIDAMEVPLREVLGLLQDIHGITFIVDEEAFRAEMAAGNITDTPVRVQRFNNVALVTILRSVLSQLQPPGTYIVRSDHIEITTGTRALSEKVIRAYPVADLVIPIPNSVNQLGLQQNLNVLGQTFSLGGGFLGIPIGGGLGALGAGLNAGLGVIGQFGVGLNAGLNAGLGVVGAGLNAGLGVVGVAGQLGAAALGLAGGAMGQFGANLGFAGQMQNLGLGGGFTGFGGGQLGQFGNLGGQFGLQGGDQSSLLVQLIVETVARGEWAQAPALLGGAIDPNTGLPGAEPGLGDPNAPILNADQLNSLGFYPPAQALVVRATSRVHSSTSSILPKRIGAPPVAQVPNNARPGAVVIGPRQPGGGNDQPVAQNPNQPAQPMQVVQNPGGANPPSKEKVARREPREVWKQFMDSGVNNPSLIIAGADFLVQCREFEHAAELLRANLRSGVVVQPWVHEALAIALAGSGAAAEEIERARLSCVDLEPSNAQAYIRAGRALSELGRHEQAAQMCRRAALLDADNPEIYTNALVYAERAAEANPNHRVDSDLVGWASVQLLRRDWPVDSEQYHTQARTRFESLTKRLADQQRQDEVLKLREALSREQVRDLIVELTWQGAAELDLRVDEPINTTCTVTQRQTPNGGVLIPNAPGQTKEVYTVAEGFSGTYSISVDTIWGRPVGGRATVKVTRHQGTPQQRQEIFTVNLDRPEPINIILDNARRTTVASVSAPVRRPPVPGEQRTQEQEVFERLRAMADPIYSTSTTARGFQAGLSYAQTVRMEAAKQGTTTTPVTHGTVQLGLRSGIGADLTFKSIVDQNGQAGLAISPVFQTAALNDRPIVSLSLIPGARRD